MVPRRFGFRRLLSCRIGCPSAPSVIGTRSSVGLPHLGQYTFVVSRVLWKQPRQIFAGEERDDADMCAPIEKCAAVDLKRQILSDRDYTSAQYLKRFFPIKMLPPLRKKSNTFLQHFLLLPHILTLRILNPSIESPWSPIWMATFWTE